MCHWSKARSSRKQLSRTKAKGVWQFMSGTGLNGLRQDWYIDERSDPEKATIAAAKYLGTLAQTLRRRLAPSARLLQRRSRPPATRDEARRPDDFWKLAENPKLLPRETRDYVPMILAAIVIARNPVQYGFDIESERLPSYETVTLARPVDLRRVAEWTNTSITTSRRSTRSCGAGRRRSSDSGTS